MRPGRRARLATPADAGTAGAEITVTNGLGARQERWAVVSPREGQQTLFVFPMRTA